MQKDLLTVAPSAPPQSGPVAIVAPAAMTEMNVRIHSPAEITFLLPDRLIKLMESPPEQSKSCMCCLRRPEPFPPP